MMAEYTDDVARLADMIRGTEPSTFETCARRLLDQGVTLPPPPPDPAVVVAGELWPTMFRGGEWLPDQFESQRVWTAAVRDLFTPEALAEAAAKVQEADR